MKKKVPYVKHARNLKTQMMKKKKKNFYFGRGFVFLLEVGFESPFKVIVSLEDF